MNLVCLLYCQAIVPNMNILLEQYETVDRYRPSAYTLTYVADTLLLLDFLIDFHLLILLISHYGIS